MAGIPSGLVALGLGLANSSMGSNSGLLADSSANLQANSFTPSYTSTATAAGTTTLTVASTQLQKFTGTTTQTVVLPDVTTLVIGHTFDFNNQSSGVVTVESSGGNVLVTIAPGAFATVVSNAVTGTTAASWDVAQYGIGTGTLPINNGGTPDPVLATTAALAAATVPASILGVHVIDFSSLGDGGGHRRVRVTAQPSWGGIRSQDRFLPNGTTDPTNGGWWDVDEPIVNELMFGGVSSASNATQTAAVQSMLNYCGSNLGRKALNVAPHLITAGITMPANTVLEWPVQSAQNPAAIWDKVFNGDMINMADGCSLVRPQLRGNGGSWTGRGIVVNSGNYQTLYDPFVIGMAGYCLEFPTGGVGTVFRCYGGQLSCTNTANSSIGMPATESTTIGYRWFYSTNAGGGSLIDFKNGNYTVLVGCVGTGFSFAGNTTGRVKMLGCRLAAAVTAFGTEHAISGCSVGVSLTLGSGCTYCNVESNIIAGDTEVVDSSGNGTNRVEQSMVAYTPTWTATTTNPVLGNGTSVFYFSRTGKTLHITGQVTMGSTTTFGTGTWQFGLPLSGVTSKGAARGIVHAFSSGVTNHIGVVQVSDGSATLTFTGEGIAGSYGPTTPQTWKAADYLVFTIDIIIQ